MTSPLGVGGSPLPHRRRGRPGRHRLPRGLPARGARAGRRLRRALPARPGLGAQPPHPRAPAAWSGSRPDLRRHLPAAVRRCAPWPGSTSTTAAGARVVRAHPRGHAQRPLPRRARRRRMVRPAGTRARPRGLVGPARGWRRRLGRAPVGLRGRRSRRRAAVADHPRRCEWRGPGALPAGPVLADDALGVAAGGSSPALADLRALTVRVLMLVATSRRHRHPGAARGADPRRRRATRSTSSASGCRRLVAAAGVTASSAGVQPGLPADGPVAVGRDALAARSGSPAGCCCPRTATRRSAAGPPARRRDGARRASSTSSTPTTSPRCEVGARLAAERGVPLVYDTHELLVRAPADRAGPTPLQARREARRRGASSAARPPP